MATRSVELADSPGMRVRVITLTADEAHPGDVVLASDGQVYQAPGSTGTQGWSTMQLIGFYGDPADTAPPGELVLLARGGRPAVTQEGTT